MGRSSLRASTLGTDWFPWDEALLEHRHLGQTDKKTKPLTVLITMPLTEGQSMTLTDTLKLAVTVELTATLLLINTNQFSWDEALLEHRHLGQTGSLGTKLS